MSVKEYFFQIVAENFSQILTAAMGVFSVVAVSRQSKKQQKHEAAQKYVDIKFRVFQSFIDALAQYEGNPCTKNLNTLVSAQNKVIIMVHPVYAEVFDNFCMVLIEVSNTQQTRNGLSLELETKFKTSLKIVRGILQDEMQEFDPGKHKLAKLYLRKRKIKKLLEKTHYISKKQ